MKKGFLLIDGQKNCILIFQEDLYKPFDNILEEKVKQEEVKKHNKRSELYLTVSDYLKGIYKVNPEDMRGDKDV